LAEGTGPASPVTRPRPERKIYTATLERIEELSPTVRSFFLKLPPDAGFHFRAGQFISIRLDKGELEIRKPYSIASSPVDPGVLELCIKRVEGGYVSNRFFSLARGATIRFDGPDGVFYLRDPVGPELYFIGTGTGIAPLRSMILWLFSQDTPKKVTLLFGVRKENEILYNHDFLEIAARRPNFRYLPVVSRPEAWKGRTGHVQDQIEGLIANPAGEEFFLCGLPSMVDAVREKLKGMGYKRQQIHFEKYV
jgi:NAD(P)H-flavin reductase